LNPNLYEVSGLEALRFCSFGYVFGLFLRVRADRQIVGIGVIVEVDLKGSSMLLRRIWWMRIESD
jgi:hypothetical protein